MWEGCGGCWWGSAGGTLGTVPGALLCSFTNGAGRAGELEGDGCVQGRMGPKPLKMIWDVPRSGAGKMQKEMGRSWCSSMAELPRGCSMGSLAEGAGSGGGVWLQGAEKDMEGLKFFGDLP